MQCSLCTGRFGRALNLWQEVVSRASPHLSSHPNTHSSDALGAAVLLVSTLDTAGSCVSHSCMWPGVSAGAPPHVHMSAHPMPSHGPANIGATRIPSVLPGCHLCAIVPDGSFGQQGSLGPAAQICHRSRMGSCHSASPVNLSAEVFSSIPKERRRVHWAGLSEQCSIGNSLGVKVNF